MVGSYFIQIDFHSAEYPAWFQTKLLNRLCILGGHLRNLWTLLSTLEDRSLHH